MKSGNSKQGELLQRVYKGGSILKTFFGEYVELQSLSTTYQQCGQQQRELFGCVIINIENSSNLFTAWEESLKDTVSDYSFNKVEKGSF